MKVCLYARVSTSDKEQNPETQLLPLREFVKKQEWEVYGEFIDHVPAICQVSRRQAAKELNVGYATLKRLIDAQEKLR